MTDLETMRAMLRRAGIEFEETTRRTREFLVGEETEAPIEAYEIRIERGYPYFYTLMTFSPDGALQNVEAYE